MFLSNVLQGKRATSGGIFLLWRRFLRPSQDQKVINKMEFYKRSTFDFRKRYFDGAERNLDALLRHYGPDWKMRLYHDLEEGHPMHK